MGAHPDAKKPELLGVDFRTKRLTKGSCKFRPRAAVGGMADMAVRLCLA